MTSTESQTKPSYILRVGLGTKSKSVITASTRRDRIVSIVADGKVKKSTMGSSKSLKQVDQQEDIEERDEKSDFLNKYEVDIEKIIEARADMDEDERVTTVDQQNKSTEAPIESSSNSKTASYFCLTTIMNDVEIGKSIVVEELSSACKDRQL